MNKKLLSLAVATAATTFAGLASAEGPSVYGKINLSLSSYDLEKVAAGAAVKDQDNWKLESHSSRLGVMGDFAINDNLKAIYKAEFQVDPDDGDTGAGTFKQRNIYGGIQGSWGTLLTGKHDTILHMAQGKVDLFDDTPIGDFKNVMVGDNRVNNVILYASPNMDGLSFSAMIMPGEESGTGPDDDDGLADSASAGVTYKKDGLYLALAQDYNIANTNTLRLVADYKMDAIKIGFVWQTADEEDRDGGIQSVGGASGFGSPNEQDAFLISGLFSASDKLDIKIQYAYSESSYNNSALDDVEVTQFSIGADYKLSNSMLVKAFYTNLESEGDASFTGDTVEDQNFGVGYIMKF